MLACCAAAARADDEEHRIPSVLDQHRCRIALYLTLVVDGLRAHDASSLPQPPLTSPKYRRAMRSFARRRRG